MQSVGFDPTGRRRVWVEPVERFGVGALQHGVGEVGAENLCAAFSRLFAQGERHVAGAAAKIENARVWFCEQVCESCGQCAATTTGRR